MVVSRILNRGLRVYKVTPHIRRAIAFLVGFCIRGVRVYKVLGFEKRLWNSDFSFSVRV